MLSSNALSRRIVYSAASLAVALALVSGCSRETPADAPRGAGLSLEDATDRAVPVVLGAAARRDFVESLAVQGTLEAKNVAMVSPRMPGILEAIYVEEGGAVVAGETKLFQTDSEKMEKAVEVSEQDLAVAVCAKREAAANLEQMEAQFEKAEADYGRFQRLLEKKAVTPDAFERQESRFKQTRAGLKHAKTLVDLAAERAHQAAAALAIAEKTLKDSTALAPISGRVSMRAMEPGEMGDPGQWVLQITDTSVVELSAFVPEQYYRRIEPGATRVRISLTELDAGEFTVTYKSPTIQAQLRTFEIKCRIDGPGGGIVPGALATAEILLDRRSGLGVPSQAVQQRGGTSVVFTVRDGRAQMVAVAPGLTTEGYTEVDAEGLDEGSPVVTMGQYLINDGTPVAIREEAG